MDRPHRLTLVAIILAAVALITTLAVGGILSAQTAANDAARAKDVSIALAYEHRTTALSECERANATALVRIAAGQALIQASIRTNPTPTVAQQWLLVDFARKANAAVRKANPVKKCSVPALGLPQLPPITKGAQEILDRASPTTRGEVGTATTVAPTASVPVVRRPTTTTICGCPSTTHCEKRANRGICRGKP